MWLLFVLAVAIPLLIGIVAGIVKEVEAHRQFKYLHLSDDSDTPTLKQRIISNFNKHPKLIKWCFIILAVEIVLFFIILKI